MLPGCDKQVKLFGTLFCRDGKKKRAALYVCGRDGTMPPKSRSLCLRELSRWDVFCQIQKHRTMRFERLYA
jgi:hypothetical protein